MGHPIQSVKVPDIKCQVIIFAVRQHLLEIVSHPSNKMSTRNTVSLR